MATDDSAKHAKQAATAATLPHGLLCLADSDAVKAELAEAAMNSEGDDMRCSHGTALPAVIIESPSAVSTYASAEQERRTAR
jgi:hypothetical protein